MMIWPPTSTQACRSNNVPGAASALTPKTKCEGTLRRRNIHCVAIARGKHTNRPGILRHAAFTAYKTREARASFAMSIWLEG